MLLHALTAPEAVNATTHPDLSSWISVNYDATPPIQLAILDAAAQAFTTYGFAAASIDLIASQIGATKGSVYYHYRSKADLFFAVHKRAMVINLKALLPIVEDSALDPVKKLGRMCYQHAMLMMEFFYYQRVTVQGVELHQSRSTTPSEREALAQVVAMRDAYEGLFRQVLERGESEGYFGDIEPSLAAKSILGSLNWITVWYRPRTNDSSQFKHHVAEQLARHAVFGVAEHTAQADFLPSASGKQQS
jgi:AcrR family transcriptional regulator